MDSWRRDKSYGNMAENIVEMLIKSMPNWKCIGFGVENHIQELKKVVRKDINEVTKKIKSMPDFIAFNEDTGETLFIEAKYRSTVSEKSKYGFGYKRLNEYLEYWEGTKLVIVIPFEPYFVVVDLDKVDPSMREPVMIGPKQWMDNWDFKGVQQDIKEFFSDLTDEALKTAIELIPSKNNL